MLKRKLLLIKGYDIFAFLPTMVGVHNILKSGRPIKAYRFYRLKTGKGLYETKNIVDRYYAEHFLIKKRY